MWDKDAMDRIASVILSNSTREFDREYHYIVPEELCASVTPGVRVIVPFGKGDRPREAFVLSLPENSDTAVLKQIKTVVDKTPLLDSSMLKLAVWMKKRYICTYYDAIKCMLPPGIGVKSIQVVKLTVYGECIQNLKGSARKLAEALYDNNLECELEELKKITGIRSINKLVKEMEQQGVLQVHDSLTCKIKEKTVRAAYLVMPGEEILDDIESGKLKRIQQIRVLEMLLENEFISVSDLARFAGVSTGVLDTLRKYGYINYRDIEVRRDPLKNRTIERTSPFSPTAQQTEVLKTAVGMMEESEGGELLIHGVTGSGKTEVYLQLIRYSLDKGKNAIVLVPEISLTPQMVERFKGRFGSEVAVLHSRLSLGERYDEWKKIKEGGVKVVVGARSAVFAPLEKLGIIIIDEEHETSYKSEMTPKYHARDIARERCRQEGALLLYGSATPSVETYYKAVTGQIKLAEMTERTNKMVMPKVELINMRTELDEGNRTIFSSCLSEEIKSNIKTGQQTILFLNRRGYSSFVLCRKCGYVVRCSHCNVSMTYHSHDQRLICHYCGYTVKNPEVCPKCKSSYIRYFGTGTQKVEEELQKTFPGCTAIRMDMDTTSFKNSHEEILNSFRKKNINILIGTQMIAKGHDFPNVTLVGVLAADSLLNTGDFRASERTFQLITQVAGRAGRGELPGRVIVQTYNTEDFSILTACKHDFKSFYKQEIIVRQKLDYPPFTNIAELLLSGTFDRNVFTASRDVKEKLCNIMGDCGDDCIILGPSRSPVTKIRNRYRWRIIIKCKRLDLLISHLTSISDEFSSSRKFPGVMLGMDINPANML